MSRNNGNVLAEHVRVLLIEGHGEDARWIERALFEAQAARFELEKASMLSAGLERIAAGGIDLCLIDLSLPDSEGLETFERLAAEAPNLPVIVLSGLADQSVGARAVNAGAQDYLVKGRTDSDAVARAVLYAIERHELQQELRRLAIVDELTELHNRRGFMTLGEAAMRSALRSQTPLTLLFIDVNDMKTINDTYGHQEGDRALADVAGILRENFRDTDIVARIGGDEFCALLVGAVPGMSNGGPATRLRKKVDAFNLAADRQYALSISVGAHTYDPAKPTTLEDLIEEADRLMYMEKVGRERRPRVLVVDDDPSLRRLAEVMFSGEFEVVTAASGGEAAAIVSTGRFDAMLLDMHLPDMPGTDVVRHMRADPATRRTPIIVLTGQQDPATELESLRLGVDDFVRKPFEPEILMTRVTNAIQRRRAR